MRGVVKQPRPQMYNENIFHYTKYKITRITGIFSNIVHIAYTNNMFVYPFPNMVIRYTNFGHKGVKYEK